MDGSLQRSAPRRGLDILDVAHRAGLLGLVPATGTVRVPRHEERVVASAAMLPTGIHRAGDHVVEVGPIARVEPLALGVVEGRNLPPGLVRGEGGGCLNSAQVVEGATADTHGVSNHGPSRHGRGVVESDHSTFSRAETKRTHVPPREPMACLVDENSRSSPGMVNRIARILRAVAAVTVPNVDGVAAIFGQRRGVGDNGAWWASDGLGIAVGLTGYVQVVAGIRARRPDTALLVAVARSGHIVVDDVRIGGHVALAGGPDHRTGVPEVM